MRQRARQVIRKRRQNAKRRDVACPRLVDGPTALFDIQRERAERRAAIFARLEADPAVELCRQERARKAAKLSPILDEAKQEFEAHNAARSRKGSNNGKVGRPPNPFKGWTSREKVLYDIEIQSLNKLGHPGT